MLWSAHRRATRAENIAYSLLGICDINISMQCAEGNKAFVGLRIEILLTTTDPMCRCSLGDWNWNRFVTSQQSDIRQCTFSPLYHLGMLRSDGKLA